MTFDGAVGSDGVDDTACVLLLDDGVLEEVLLDEDEGVLVEVLPDEDDGDVLPSVVKVESPLSEKFPMLSWA